MITNINNDNGYLNAMHSEWDPTKIMIPNKITEKDLHVIRKTLDLHMQHEEPFNMRFKGMYKNMFIHTHRILLILHIENNMPKLFVSPLWLNQ